MSISLVEVAGANFRTDYNSDELNTDFMGRLGMRKRYLPARLAIALSLARQSQPDPLPKGYDWGKTIKGDTLFDTGATLSVWLALIVQHSAESDMDVKCLITLVAAHWRRGLSLLDEEWRRADEDMAQFVRQLVTVAELPIAGGAPGAQAEVQAGQTFSSGRIDVSIGEDVGTKEKTIWGLNRAGGSPHSAIMGGVGAGKTRTAVAMLGAIRQQAADLPLLAFDFKGDLGAAADGGGYGIDQLFKADTLAPPRTPVPLDVLALTARDELAINEAAMRFRESLARLKGSRLGDKQRTVLYEAAARALANNTPCELRHIRDAFTEMYEERDIKEDGASATMQDICRFPLFTPQLSPAEFFQHSWIIQLPPNVAEDNRTMVVNLLLDGLDQYLNSLAEVETGTDGTRGLRILCMIDEAHHILGTKLPALSSLIRMSRSKGGAIMLISQSPDDFSGEDDEFLDNMGLVAAFASNAAPNPVKRIFGKKVNLGALEQGQCFIKLRGERDARKIKAW